MDIALTKHGDFYIATGEQARTMAAALGLVLTERSGESMCAIPFYSLTRSVQELEESGHVVLVGRGSKQVDRT